MATQETSLVPISVMEVDGEHSQTVSARDLHKSLGIKAQFSDWVKYQLRRADLLEGRDYVTVAKNSYGDCQVETNPEVAGSIDPFLTPTVPIFRYGDDYLLAQRGEQLEDLSSPKKGSAKSGRFTREQETYLTVDSAKHISMMSSTPKGKEVRNYFIGVEKAYRARLSWETRAEALRITYPQALDELRPASLKAAQKDLKALANKKCMKLVKAHLDEVKVIDDLEKAKESMLMSINFYLENALKFYNMERA